MVSGSVQPASLEALFCVHQEITYMELLILREASGC